MVKLVAALALGVGLALVPITYFGSADAMRAWVSGRAVHLELEKTFYIATVGQQLTIPARVWNFTDKAIPVFGTKSNCGCPSAPSPPSVLVPRVVTLVEFVLNAKDRGEWKYEVELYADAPPGNRTAATVDVRIDE